MLALRQAAAAAVARGGRRGVSAGGAVGRCASTLVVAEHDNETLHVASRVAVSAAREVGGDVTLLVAGTGSGADAVCAQARAVEGVTRVLRIADDAAFAHSLAENTAAAIQRAVQEGEYSHVLAAATNSGKNALPRAAAVLGVSPVTDVIKVEAEDTFVRPMYAGNAFAKVQAAGGPDGAPTMLTVRTTAFDAAPDGGDDAPVDELDGVEGANLAQFESENKTQSARPDLGTASIVVSGGRGFQNGENFVLLDPIADKLGAGVGASRAAVDAGWVPSELQIGQTGRQIAPDLYMCFGISGAIQHLAGVKDSKVIVAVNKDPDAPIHQVADYSLVDDLFKVIPELEQKL